ncbi:MAG: hypothetical protein AseanaTS_21800 [Candidatus Pelagadaptatus aseana]|uniref:polysaccharide pyruvyl transferase family protein n=1 Tax=Candidatus Pelagadaptatus aseana TaxID=3120508 RepID=UPI0039B235D7
MPKNNINVLLLDFAQQTNTGDDVMQRALIELCRDNVSSNITISTYFGANELLAVREEFGHYEEGYGLPVVGGVINTYFNRGRWSRSLGRVFQAIFCVFLLILLRFNVPSSFVRVLLTSKQKNTFDVYNQADIVIWNGRNFRGSGGAGEALKIFELCVNPFFCLMLEKPVFCIGASVWPLKSKIAKWLMKAAVKNSKAFLVRENDSYNYLYNELKLSECPSLDRIPDLSFYVINQYLHKNKTMLHRGVTGLVGLTLIGRRELPNDEIYSRYLNAFSKLVSHISKKDLQIKIIPQVTYNLEPYEKELYIIASQNPNVELEIVEGELGFEGLLDQYMGVDILVASRMHSAIFARSLGVPVTAVAYDEGAKWGILDGLNVHRGLVLSASTLSSEELINNFDEVHSGGVDMEVPELVDLLASKTKEKFKIMLALN